MERREASVPIARDAPRLTRADKLVRLAALHSPRFGEAEERCPAAAGKDDGAARAANNRAGGAMPESNNPILVIPDAPKARSGNHVPQRHGSISCTGIRGSRLSLRSAGMTDKKCARPG